MKKKIMVVYELKDEDKNCNSSRKLRSCWKIVSGMAKRTKIAFTYYDTIVEETQTLLQLFGGSSKICDEEILNFAISLIEVNQSVHPSFLFILHNISFYLVNNLEHYDLCSRFVNLCFRYEKGDVKDIAVKVYF